MPFAPPPLDSIEEEKFSPPPLDSIEPEFVPPPLESLEETERQRPVLTNPPSPFGQPFPINETAAAVATLGLNADVASGEGPGPLEMAMTPIVNLPPVPAKVIKALSPVLAMTGERGQQVAKGLGEFASEAVSSLTAPGMMVLGGVDAVAPPVAAAVIAAMGAQSIGPEAVEAIEASKRGDLTAFTKHTAATALAGVMTGAARGVRLKPTPVDQALQPMASRAVEAMIQDKPPVLAFETKPRPIPEPEPQPITEGVPNAVQEPETAQPNGPVPEQPEQSAEAVGDMMRLARQRADTRKAAGDQAELFGFDDSAIREMEAQSALVSRERSGIRAQINTVKGAAKRPEIAKEFGIDVADPEGVKKKVAELEARLALLKDHPELAGKLPGETAPPTAPVPTLRQGEAAGELFQGKDQPFNLAGETTIDAERVATEKAKAEADSAEAARIEAENQPALIASRPGGLPSVLPSAPAPMPKALSQVIRDLSTGLGVPIRFGRLLSSKVGGYFLERPNLIGSKRANDILVVSHEAGHKLDSLFSVSSQPHVRAELMHLGDNSRPGSMSSWTKSKSAKYRRGEGFAEFLRYWLTDPAEAAKLAPKLSAHFEGLLAASHDLNKVMRQAREDVQTWRVAEPQARLRSSISIGEDTRTRYTLSDLTRDIVDDLHYLRLASDDAKALGTPGLKPSKDPYVMARLLRGAYGVADTFLKSGSIDFKTRDITGPGLKQILETVGPRIDDFRDYIVARQAKEMQAQGKPTGLVPSDIDFVVNKFGKDTEFNAAFDALKNWSDQFIDYSVDAGYLSPDGASAMRLMNKEYVPMHRIFEVGAGELGAEGQGASGRGLNAVKSTFKGRKGSARDIVDPLETYVKNAYAILLNADKNAVNIAIADMANRPGMGKWVERIAQPKEIGRVGIEKIRDDLEASGADLTNVPDDLLLTFWKDSNRAPTGENIIRVNRGGKLEFYRLNAELYKTVQALDSESAGTLLKILSAPAQLLRAGATLTPDFAISNAMRDTVSSAVISRYGVFPVEATLKGIYSLLKNPKITQEWKASGGAQSVEAHYFDRAALQNFLKKEISKDFSIADYAKTIAKSPLTALRVLSGTLEEATRIGEFQRVVAKLTAKGYDIGEARRLAAFESRDLQDFAMGGAKTKSLRRITAFWNAAMQGNYRLYQNLKDPNTRMATMAKATAWVTIPTVTLFAINKDNPDYWDRPQWERDVFWLVPRGKDDLGHTKFLRIPKPFEIGLLFGTVPERAMQFWYKQDPDSFDGLLKQIANQTIPNPIPQTVVTLFGAFLSGERGYDLFRGRPIVPQSMENYPPELQVTEQTSLTARRIGDIVKFSPLKTDYIINNAVGGLGRQVVNQGLDRVLSWVTGEPRTARATMPGARFLGVPAGVQSAAVEKLYDTLKILRRERARRKLTGSGDDSGLAIAENAAERLSSLRKRQHTIKDETERQKISLEMREVAERANSQIKRP